MVGLQTPKYHWNRAVDLHPTNLHSLHTHHIFFFYQYNFSYPNIATPILQSIAPEHLRKHANVAIYSFIFYMIFLK